MSNCPSVGLLTGNPSIITSVCVPAPPRILMFSRLPALPLLWTSRPGIPWRTSPAVAGFLSSMSSRVTTLTDDACSDAFCSMRVAVTTIGSSLVASSPHATPDSPATTHSTRKTLFHFLPIMFPPLPLPVSRGCTLSMHAIVELHFSSSLGSRAPLQ
jgi:hypothetical protein